jgi:NADH-quinone oxidoreductase subunit G
LNTQQKEPANFNKLALQIAKQLSQNEQAVIVLGAHFKSDSVWNELLKVIAQIIQSTNIGSVNLSLKSNALSAQKIGFTPKNKGLNTREMLSKNMQAFILLDVYPDYDFHQSFNSVQAFSQSDFVIALNTFQDETLLACCDVMLPIAAFYETSGTQININQTVQNFEASVCAPNEAKPGWKVIKVLADLLELSGFHYSDSKQISNEALQQKPSKLQTLPAQLVAETDNISLLWQSLPNAADALLRHSKALQSNKLNPLIGAFMNAKTAKKLALTEKNSYFEIPVCITSKVANDCVFLWQGNLHSGGQE